MTAANVTSAADHPWTCHHSPFRVSRTSHMLLRPGSVSASPRGSTSTAVCCASSTSKSSPKRNGRGSSHAACSPHGNSRRLTPATGRARLTLPESANFHSCAFFTCAIATKISQDRIWNLCALSHQASVGGPKKPSQPMSSPRAPSSGSRSLRPRTPSRANVPLPARVPLPDALNHARGTLEHDQRDRRGHAHARVSDAELTPWLLLLVCAPQHVAKEFHSIMRDSRPHIKLCCVQRIFTGYTKPLDRAYMRVFKNSIGQEGSRVQPRTCQSGLQYRSAPSAAALIRAHSSTGRRQPATSSCWLALHRLERGGAA